MLTRVFPASSATRTRWGRRRHRCHAQRAARPPFLARLATRANGSAVRAVSAPAKKAESTMPTSMSTTAVPVSIVARSYQMECDLRSPSSFSLREAFVLPGGARPGPSFPLREAVFFAPRAWSGRAGWASSPALRPACACDRAVALAAGPLVVRLCLPPTPHGDRRARDPHAPARWLLFARGADVTPTIPFAGGLLEPSRQTGYVAARFRPSALWEGVINPPSGCQRPCLPRPRGPSARAGTGCR